MKQIDNFELYLLKYMQAKLWSLVLGDDCFPVISFFLYWNLYIAVSPT